jgi:ribosome maturation factor RimP
MLLRSSFQVQDLTALFEPVIQSMGYELVGVEFLGSTQHGTLRVYIDHENGIGVDDCAAISHQISGILDVEEPIQQAYDLEVSSPGINRPLFRARDYEQFSGHSAKIKMAVALDGRKNFKGLLQGVTDTGAVEIMVDNEVYELSIGDIAKANLTDEIK